MLMKAPKGVASIALSGTLAFTGVVGILGIQAVGPMPNDRIAYADTAALENAIAAIEAIPDPSQVTLADDTPSYSNALENLTTAALAANSSEFTPALFNRLKNAMEKATSIEDRFIALREAADAAFLKIKIKSVKVKVGKRKAKVSWKKVKDANLGYAVYMSKKKKTGYKLVEETFDVSKTKVPVINLKKGQRYYFKVRGLRFPESEKYDDGSENDLKSKFSTAVRSKKIK